MSKRIIRIWESAPLNPTWIKGGTPLARISPIANDGVVSTGYWHCTEGCFLYHYAVDETIVLMEGLALIDGRLCDVGATRHFKRGTTALWHVIRPVTKMYVLEAPRSFWRRVVRRLGSLL